MAILYEPEEPKALPVPDPKLDPSVSGSQSSSEPPPPPSYARKGNARMRYTILDIPPWYETIFLGFQHYLTMLGSTVLIPFLIVPVRSTFPTSSWLHCLIHLLPGLKQQNPECHIGCMRCFRSLQFYTANGVLAWLFSDQSQALSPSLKSRQRSC